VTSVGELQVVTVHQSDTCGSRKQGQWRVS